jgi:hypothetical protein
MSAPAVRRKAAENLEFEGCKLGLALNWPTDSASRHAGPESEPAARCDRGFADLP